MIFWPGRGALVDYVEKLGQQRCGISAFEPSSGVVIELVPVAWLDSLGLALHSQTVLEAASDGQVFSAALRKDGRSVVLRSQVALETFESHLFFAALSAAGFASAAVAHLSWLTDRKYRVLVTRTKGLRST